MIIGLTGPLGSGKNEVCKILRRWGAYVIGADEVGHELLQDIWPDVVKAFGSKVLKRGGKINRRKLGQIVFSDPSALKKLDALIHPLMKKKIEGIVSLVQEKQKLIVINAALLKEIGLISLCNEVWVITAPTEKRIKWLLEKGKYSKEKINNIMKSQMSEANYLEIADKAIKNNGTKKELREEIRKLKEILI